MEKFTPTDKAFYKNLGLTHRSFFHERPMSNPHDPEFRKKVGEIFPVDFISMEETASMHKMGEQLAKALEGHSSDEAQRTLIKFGVAVIPALEAITVFDTGAVESRVSLSLCSAQEKVRMGQGKPPMRHIERFRMHTAFSEALEEAYPIPAISETENTIVEFAPKEPQYLANAAD
jgi:hypothetical protein